MGVVFDGYLSFGGVEVANIARTAQYAMGAGRRPPRLRVFRYGPAILPQMLGVARYNSPEADGAPWASAAHPESWGFAGLVPLSIDLGGNFSRPVSENVGDGGALGRLRAGTLPIHVTATLIGATCCSVAYGLRWLTSTLMRPAWCDGDDTEGADAVFLSCVPSPDELWIDEDDDLEDPATIAEVAACAARFLRTAKGAALVAAPTVVSRQGGGCGSCGGAGSLTVEWTMAARMPWLYTEPDVIVDDVALDAGEEIGWPFTWIQVDPVTGAESSPCEPFPHNYDPLCQALPAAPRLPLLTVGCACVPVTSARVVRDVPADVAFDSELVVSVTAGAAALRNVLVQAVENPLGLGADELEPCAGTDGLLISFVPAFGTVTVDGSTRTATLTAEGNEEPADALIASWDGGPYQWPTVGCVPTTILVDGPPDADGASVSVSLVGREPA